MQEDYPAMAGAAKKAIENRRGNAMAIHYLLGKADNGQGDGIMCIAHLTKAIILKDDFIEARLLRAEAYPNAAIQGSDGRHRHHSGTRPGRRKCHLARGKIEEATETKKSRKQLSESDGVESLNEQASST